MAVRVVPAPDEAARRREHVGVEGAALPDTVENSAVEKGVAADKRREVHRPERLHRRPEAAERGVGDRVRAGKLKTEVLHARAFDGVDHGVGPQVGVSPQQPAGAARGTQVEACVRLSSLLGLGGVIPAVEQVDVEARRVQAFACESVRRARVKDLEDLTIPAAVGRGACWGWRCRVRPGASTPFCSVRELHAAQWLSSTG
eukprot:7383184-Prymnesium_polylepis.1